MFFYYDCNKEGDSDGIGIYFVLGGTLQMITEKESSKGKITTKWRLLKVV